MVEMSHEGAMVENSNEFDVYVKAYKSFELFGFYASEFQETLAQNGTDGFPSIWRNIFDIIIIMN